MLMEVLEPESFIAYQDVLDAALAGIAEALGLPKSYITVVATLVYLDLRRLTASTNRSGVEKSRRLKMTAVVKLEYVITIPPDPPDAVSAERSFSRLSISAASKNATTLKSAINAQIKAVVRKDPSKGSGFEIKTITISTPIQVVRLLTTRTTSTTTVTSTTTSVTTTTINVSSRPLPPRPPRLPPGEVDSDNSGVLIASICGSLVLICLIALSGVWYKRKNARRQQLQKSKTMPIKKVEPHIGEPGAEPPPSWDGISALGEAHFDLDISSWLPGDRENLFFDEEPEGPPSSMNVLRRGVDPVPFMNTSSPSHRGRDLRVGLRASADSFEMPMDDQPDAPNPSCIPIAGAESLVCPPPPDVQPEAPHDSSIPYAGLAFGSASPIGAVRALMNTAQSYGGLTFGATQPQPSKGSTWGQPQPSKSSTGGLTFGGPSIPDSAHGLQARFSSRPSQGAVATEFDNGDNIPWSALSPFACTTAVDENAPDWQVPAAGSSSPSRAIRDRAGGWTPPPPDDIIPAVIYIREPPQNWMIPHENTTETEISSCNASIAPRVSQANFWQSASQHVRSDYIDDNGDYGSYPHIV